MNNERKMRYEEPLADIIMFDVEDVLTTSFDGDMDPTDESSEVTLPKVPFGV